jgi:alpha-glucosidase (family GH31 glycosyl hydrolase)
MKPAALPLTCFALLLGALTALAPGASSTAAEPGRLGQVTGFEADGDTYTFASGDALVRVVFYDDDMFRIWLAPDGQFSDPANDPPADPADPDADIVVKRDYAGADSRWSEQADAYELRTDDVVLRVGKNPMTFALYDADDGGTIWRETAPLSWDAAGVTQQLARGADEQFFGGGMQNGRFSHRDQTLAIERNYDWDDGGYPNASPFYLSTAGYGVLRNTFASGSYAFSEPVATTHDEQRFDAYYFVGDAKQVLDGYTELTGRPMMLPMWGMEMGSADCYLHNANRGERETLRDSLGVADGYVDRGIPLGWMLVNDGYGCGYEDLAATGDALQQRDIELGLWTESDLTNQEQEVEAGVRVRKTDIAWVGPGYRFALDACETAHDGIADNSGDRPSVVTIEGWAGSQRCGTLWSGDQSGSWDYIRWQIPTYAGSTMSGQATTTGDVDGIFGGSAETYTRDLQWKMFLPYTYAMNGWAAKDKHPWVYGEPYTSINRDYLMLHERLLPYFYTYAAQAHRTGVGMVRPLALAYPDDPTTWGDAVKYEFLSGDDFLVAPVYSDTEERDGIYLPAGTWVDYWTGRTYDGRQTLDDHPAQLERMPLFVKGGAIVPMFPAGTTDWRQGKQAGQLDLDLYPQGTNGFTLYEDDGRSQEYAAGASAEQDFAMAAPQSGPGNVRLDIGALRGSYEGKPTTRRYLVHAHTGSAPATVLLGDVELPQRASESALDQADRGWWYDPDDRGGTVHVKTPSLSTSLPARLRLQGTSAIGGVHPSDRDASVELTAPTILAPGAATRVEATFRNDTTLPVRDVELSIAAPEGWHVAADGRSRFAVVDPGESVSAAFAVTPSATAEPGRYPIGGEAAYTARSQPYRIDDARSVRVPYASLAASYDNVAISPEANPTVADIDGGGSSFIAERLAAQGLRPGATVEHDGATFTWPDVGAGDPDNTLAQGQTIALSGQATHLAFLGTGTGTANGPVTVHYADGSTSQAGVGFPNWCCADPTAYGAQTVATTLGKNTPTGPAFPTVAYRVFYNKIAITPGKDVVAVTLPQNAAMHVFAMALKTERLPVVARFPSQVVYDADGAATVPVEITNTALTDVQDVDVSVTLADGTVQPETIHLDSLAAGASSSATIQLGWPAAGARLAQPHVTVTWSEGGEPGEWTADPQVRVTCAPSPSSPTAVTYVDSEETAGEDGAAVNAIDGDPATIWHTEWSAAVPPPPHEIQLDLGAQRDVCAFRYLPRSNAGNGTVADYAVYVSSDGTSWGEPVATGTFARGAAEKWVPFPSTSARYVRFVALSEINGGPWTSAAELSVDARSTG